MSVTDAKKLRADVVRGQLEHSYSALQSIPLLKQAESFGKYLKTSCELERKPEYCASPLCSEILLGMKMTACGQLSEKK